MGTASDIDSAMAIEAPETGTVNVQESEGSSAAIDRFYEDEARDQAIRESVSIDQTKTLKERSMVDTVVQKTGVSAEDAEASLANENLDQILLKSDLERIKKKAPKTYSWMGQDPANPSMVAPDRETIVQMEEDERGYLSDLASTVKGYGDNLGEAYTLIGYQSGAISARDTAKALERYRSSRLARGQEMAMRQNILELQKELAKENPEAVESLTKVLERWNDLDFDRGVEANIEGMKGLVKEGVISAGEVFDIGRALVTNPRAASIMLLESMYILGGASAASAVGSKVGATLGPKGAVAGGVSGAALSTLALTYSQKILEEIDKERELQGVDFNLEEFLKTPKFREIQKEAGVYGSFQGAFAPFILGRLGRAVTAPIKKAGEVIAKEGVKKGVIRQGLEASLKVAGEGVATGAAEAGQEALSRYAAKKLTQGEITEEEGKDIVAESIIEGWMGVAMGGGAKGLGLTAAKTYQMLGGDSSRKQTATKIKVLDGSKKALTNYERLNKAGEKIKSLKGIKANPGKTQELVREIVKNDSEPPPIPTDYKEGSRVSDNPKLEVEAEQEAMTFEGTETISLDAKVLNEWAARKEINLDGFLDSLGPEYRNEYQIALEGGGAISVPMDAYLMSTEEHPELHAVAVVGDNEFNALEGEVLYQIFNDEPVEALFHKDDEAEISEAAKRTADKGLQGLPGVTIKNILRKTSDFLTGQKKPEDLPVEGKPYVFYDRLRSDEEKLVHRSLLERFKEIEPEQAEFYAEIQMRRIQQRASVLGKPVTEIAKETDISLASKQLSESMKGVATGFSLRKVHRDLPGIIRVIRGAKNPQQVIIHELGHTWLNEMAEDWDAIHGMDADTMTPAQLEYKQAMDDVAYMLNLTKLEEGKIPTASHERFAQTAEKYFLDGKFEGTTIRRALESFRRWLTNIWGNIGRAYRQKGYTPLSITPKVESAFESILGISGKAESILNPNLPELRIDPDIIGARASEFLKEADRIYRETVGDFTQGSYLESIRKRDAWVEKNFEKFRDQAKIDLMEISPEYQEESLKEARGERSNKTLMKNLEDKRIYQILEENNPAIKSDEELHNQALASIQKVSRRKIFRLQMQAFSEKALGQLKKGIEGIAATPTDVKRMMDPLHFESEVDKTILNHTARRKASTLLTQSNRHGRKAVKLFNQGDFVEAFEHKFLQAKFFEAFQRMGRVHKRIAKISATTRRIVSSRFDKRLARRYDMDVVAFMRNFIAAFGDGDSVPNFDTEGFPNGNNIPPEVADSLNAIIDKFQALKGGTPAKDSSVEVMLLYGTIIERLVAVARNAKNMEINGREVEVAKTVETIIEEIGPRRKGDPTTGDNAYIREIKNIRAFFGGLFKNDEEFAESRLAEILVDLKNATAEFNIEFNRARKEIVDSLKKLAKTDKGFGKFINPVIRAIPVRGLEGFGIDPIESPELGVTFEGGKSEILMMIMYLSSESGAEAMILGGYKGKPLGGWDFETNTVDRTNVDRFIRRLEEEGVLTREDYEFVETVIGTFARHHEKEKSVYRYTNGVNMGSVEGSTIKTTFGDFKGGYIPIVYATNVLRENSNPFDVDKGNPRSSDMYPRQDEGFTKERVKTKKSIDLDLGKITATLHNRLRFAFIRKTLYDVAKVFNNKDFQAAIENRRPEALDQYLIPYFDQVNAQQYSPPSDDLLTEVARRIRRNALTTIFAGNWKTWLKQLAGLPPAINILGTKKVASTAARFAYEFSDMRSKAQEKSVRMRDRFKYHVQNMAKSYEFLETNTDWITNTQDFGQRMAFIPIQVAQNIVDTIVWNAAYEQAQEKGWTEKKLIDFADDAVERTQGTSNIAATSKFVHRPETARLFTPFLTPVAAQWNLIAERFAQSRDEKGLARARIMVPVLVTSVVIPAAIIQTVNEIDLQIIKGGPDDEEDATTEAMMQRYSLAAATEVLQIGFPFGGGVASDIARGYPISFAPGLEVAKTVAQAPKVAYNLLHGVDLNSRDFSTLVNSITLMTGIPFSVFGKIYKVVEDQQTPKEKRKAKRQRKRQLQRVNR